MKLATGWQTLAEMKRLILDTATCCNHDAIQLYTKKMFKGEKIYTITGKDQPCRDEMVNHMISECNKVAQKKYKSRHDWVGKVIHWEL